MRMVFVACVLLAVSFDAAQSQDSNLIVDAEYNGATFTAGTITFLRTGEVTKAILKTDFTQDGLVYKAATQIEFGNNGRVISGTLSNPLLYKETKLNLLPGPITFHANGGLRSANLKTGSTDKNVTLPIDMRVDFTAEGRITFLSPVSISFLTYPFWGRTLRNGNSVQLVYNRLAGEYALFEAMVGAPQLIGHLVTARDNFQIPTTTVPIIAPAMSTFKFYGIHPEYALNPQHTQSWYYEGNFVINGYNFGLRPSLYFRGERLTSVQIRQALTIDGVAYPVNSVIMLNDVGKILK